MTPEDIRKSVAAETALVGETVQHVLTGQPADLTGFDTRVAELCLATKALPLDDAQALVPDFELLAAALDDLRARVSTNMAAEVQAAAKP
jgi:hypothetical protein